MKLLLDTCTFVWLTSAPQLLGEGARTALDDAGNDLYLSYASYWEIAEKHRTGQLSLPASPQLWIRDRMKSHGVEEAALEAEVIFLAAELPGDAKNLFKRLLSAQSIRGGYVLLSPEARPDHPSVRVIW